jgi:hypothetical protein
MEIWIFPHTVSIQTDNPGIDRKFRRAKPRVAVASDVGRYGRFIGPIGGLDEE